MTCLAQCSTARCLPPYWMVTVDRGPVPGAGRAVAVSTESNPARPSLCPEIWEVSASSCLPPHPKLNFLLGHSHPGAPSISPDASYSLVSPIMGSPGRAPQYPRSSAAATWEHPWGSLWSGYPSPLGTLVEQGCTYPPPHWCSAHHLPPNCH